MQRIDTFLVENDLAESREQAKRLILAGAVTVNGNAKIKPGQRVPADAEVVVQEQQKYVSRGGFKLEKALSIFDVDVQDRVALDVGASTGGFTDCLLQHGAKFVYAVDVGYGQLAWKLRTHPQVQSIEKTNIRHLTPSLLHSRQPSARASTPFQPSAKTQALQETSSLADSRLLIADSHCDFITIAVIDVSFISLRTVLPSVIKILTQGNSCQSSVLTKNSSTDTFAKARVLGQSRQPEQPSAVSRQPSAGVAESHLADSRKPIADGYCDIIALLKPQFEAGKAHVKKGGIVPDKQVHIQTIDNLSVFVTEKLGATVRGLTYSPIHKDIGNIEYLLWLTIESDTQESPIETDVQLQQTTAEVVTEAHNFFQS